MSIIVGTSVCGHVHVSAFVQRTEVSDTLELELGCLGV